MPLDIPIPPIPSASPISAVTARRYKQRNMIMAVRFGDPKAHRDLLQEHSPIRRSVSRSPDRTVFSEVIADKKDELVQAGIKPFPIR